MKKKIIIGIGVLLILIILVSVISKKSNEEPVNTNQTPSEKIETIKVSDLQDQEKTITVYGAVNSSKSVDVFPEVSGVIKKVNKKFGEEVKAGEVIVELQNTSQLQSVYSAQAGYTAAQNSLTKVKNAIGPEDVESAENSLIVQEETLIKLEDDIVREIANLSPTLDAALRRDIDDFFDHVETYPVFTYRLKSEEAEEDLEKKRHELTGILANFPSDLEGVIEATDKFSTMANALYLLTPDFLGFTESEKEDLEDETLAIKETFEGYSDTFRSYKTQLISQEKAVANAEITLQDLKDGVEPEDVVISQASVNSAKASLNAAYLGLSKTKIKAPVDGQLAQIDLRPGQSVGPTSSVFSIANESILKISSFVTQEDTNRFAASSEVTVEGEYPAVVSRVAALANPNNGKIEVEITFLEQPAEIIEGQQVRADIKVATLDNDLHLPLSAVFVEDDQTFIYTRTTGDSSVKKTAVEITDFDGQNLTINLENLSEDMEIITNARAVNN